MLSGIVVIGTQPCSLEGESSPGSCKCILTSKLVSCRESDITKERIEKILKSGANVILTSKGIDDMSLKVWCCRTSLLHSVDLNRADSMRFGRKCSI